MAAAAVIPAAAVEEYQRATVRLQAVAADSVVVAAVVDLPRPTEHPVAAVEDHPPATGHLRPRAMEHRPAAVAVVVSEVVASVVVASAAERLPAATEHHRPRVMEPHLAPPVATGHRP